MVARRVHEVGRQPEAAELFLDGLADRGLAAGDREQLHEEGEERADVRAALHVDARDELEEALGRQLFEDRRQQIALARVVVGDDAEELLPHFVGQAIDDVGEAALHIGRFGRRHAAELGAGDEEALGRERDAGAFRQRELALDRGGDALRFDRDLARPSRPAGHATAISHGAAEARAEALARRVLGGDQRGDPLPRDRPTVAEVERRQVVVRGRAVVDVCDLEAAGRRRLLARRCRAAQPAGEGQELFGVDGADEREMRDAAAVELAGEPLALVLLGREVAGGDEQPVLAHREGERHALREGRRGFEERRQQQAHRGVTRRVDGRPLDEPGEPDDRVADERPHVGVGRLGGKLIRVGKCGQSGAPSDYTYRHADAPGSTNAISLDAST